MTCIIYHITQHFLELSMHSTGHRRHPKLPIRKVIYCHHILQRIMALTFHLLTSDNLNKKKHLKTLHEIKHLEPAGKTRKTNPELQYQPSSLPTCFR